MPNRPSHLLAQIERMMVGLHPDLRARIMEGYRTLVASVTEGTIVRWMASGQDVAGQIVGRATISFQRLRTGLADGMAGSFVAFGKTVPGPLVAFDALNPVHLEALRTLDTRVMRGLTEPLYQTVQDHVAFGLEQGWGSRKVARGLREVLPLAPNQSEAVRNFERMLREGDLEALTRRLRNRTFDGTIRKAFAGKGLSEAQIKQMTAAYRKRMVAFNANTHARTATLDTLRRGQRLAWKDAQDRGLIDASRMMKERVTVGDSRVREEHALENGAVVGIDEPYPITLEVVAGELSFNCRCVDRYFVRRAA